MNPVRSQQGPTNAGERVDLQAVVAAPVDFDSLDFLLIKRPMSLRLRTRCSLGHTEPCLPSPAERPPSGDGWIYEIKHDGFRIMARRDGAGVRLITRHGNDLAMAWRCSSLSAERATATRRCCAPSI